MQLILLSGSGHGAGKSTLARKLAGEHVFSLADEIRRELATEYTDISQYDFWDKTQEGKTKLVELTGKTVRDLMIERGEGRRAKFGPGYWVDKLYHRVQAEFATAYEDITCAVDDIRHANEVEILRRLERDFGVTVTHLHICFESAVLEPLYDNDGLMNIADYVIYRK